MRAIAVIVLSVVLVLGTASASAGGGASSFEFDDGYAVVGETIDGRATFYTDTRRTGRIEDGPWYAYLMPERRWIKPPVIPEDSIALGPIAIEDRGETAVASLSFTVPELELGGYTIGLCNAPCTDSMVGDLYGGHLWVAQTEEGVQLLEEIHGMEQLVYRSRSRLDRRIREEGRSWSGLEGRVDGLEGAMELRLRELERRIGTLAAAGRPDGGVPWVTVLFAGGVVSAAAVLLLRGRRRRVVLPPLQEPPIVEWEVPEEVSART